MSERLDMKVCGLCVLVWTRWKLTATAGCYNGKLWTSSGAKLDMTLADDLVLGSDVIRFNIPRILMLIHVWITEVALQRAKRNLEVTCVLETEYFQSDLHHFRVDYGVWKTLVLVAGIVFAIGTDSRRILVVDITYAIFNIPIITQFKYLRCRWD